jgi:hypothetical protein
MLSGPNGPFLDQICRQRNTHAPARRMAEIKLSAAHEKRVCVLPFPLVPLETKFVLILLVQLRSPAPIIISTLIMILYDEIKAQSYLMGCIRKNKQKSRPEGGFSSADWLALDQRLENCLRRRALCRPTFLRSTSRASRVTRPAFLRTPLSAVS